MDNTEKMRQYRARHRETYNAYMREYNKDYRAKLRLKAIKDLGGNCSNCGTPDDRVLDIHHVNGGGTKHRKGVDSRTIWRIAGESPKDYKLLCANCHRIEHAEG